MQHAGPNAEVPGPITPVDTDGDPSTELAMPAPRAGADLLGTALPIGLERGLDASGSAPRVTLYRWWTDKCPLLRGFPTCDRRAAAGLRGSRS